MPQRFPNNFKGLTAIVVFLLIIIVLFFIFWHIAILLLIISIPIILGVMIWGAFNIRSQLYLPAICRFNPAFNKIALTFDDGPKGQYTDEILDVLKNHGAKATFFCTGEMLKKYPEIALRIIEEGHEIGNHSYSHQVHFPFKSPNKISEEILKTNQSIKKLTGEEAVYFRPPFGVTNPNIAKAVKNTGMITVGWSIRSLDTVKKPPKVLEHLQKAKAGDIILMHDNRKESPKILEQFLRSYQNKGFDFASLSECTPEMLKFRY
jgi:peptidoglycan/xylan/chitin deacetylase (PgdA/CDA1 family)